MKDNAVFKIIKEEEKFLANNFSLAKSQIFADLLV